MGRRAGRNRNKVKRRDSQFWDSLYMNDSTFNNYMKLLYNIATSQFKYENAPLSLDLQYMERTLFNNGKVVIFKDEDITPELSPYSDGSNIFCLPLMDNNAIYDIYGNPTGYAVQGAQGNYRKQLTNRNSVIIYNDKIHNNIFCDLYNFSLRLEEIDRTIDVNIKAQKTPILLLGNKKTEQTLKQIYMQYDGNEPYIFGDDRFDYENAVRAINTAAPFVADRLYELKSDIWNEALTYIGIANLNINKRSQVVSDEVLRSQGGTIASRFSRYDARAEGFRRVNAMFDLDIKVEFRNTTDNFHGEDMKEEEINEIDEIGEGGGLYADYTGRA